MDEFNRKWVGNPDYEAWKQGLERLSPSSREQYFRTYGREYRPDWTSPSEDHEDAPADSPQVNRANSTPEVAAVDKVLKDNPVAVPPPLSNIDNLLNNSNKVPYKLFGTKTEGAAPFASEYGLMPQFGDYLDADGNVARQFLQGVHSKQTGVPLKSDKGRYNAASARAQGFVLPPYSSDPGSNFVDNLNDILFTLENGKRSPASLDLARRLRDTFVDFSYEALTQPSNLLMGVGELGVVGRGVDKLAKPVLSRAAKIPALLDSMGLRNVPRVGGAVSDMAHLASAASQTKEARELAGRVAVGATQGALNSDGNDREHIDAIEGGLLGFTPAVLKMATHGGNIIGDEFISYALRNSPTLHFGDKELKLSDYPKVILRGAQAADMRANAAMDLIQGRAEALKNMPDWKRVEVTDFLRKAMKIENKRGYDIYFKSAKKVFGDTAVNAANLRSYKELGDIARRRFLEEKGVKWFRELSPEDQDIFKRIVPDDHEVRIHAADGLFYEAGGKDLVNYSMNRARHWARQGLENTPEFRKLAGGLDNTSLSDVAPMVIHNQNMIDKLNAAADLDEVFHPGVKIVKTGNVDGKMITPEMRKSQGLVQLDSENGWFVTPEDFERLKKSPIVGFKYHVDNVFDKEAYEASKDLFAPSGELQRMKFGANSPARENLMKSGMSAAEADDLSYAIYADRAALSFLKKQDQEALAITNAASNDIKGSLHIGDYDKLGTLWKRNVLYGGLSWVKQQFVDGIEKSYMEHGIKGIGRAATGGVFSKEADIAMREIDRAINGDYRQVLGSKANEYRKYGVVKATQLYDALDMSPAERMLRYPPNALPDKMGVLDRTIKWQEQGFGFKPAAKWNKKIESVGQRLEWNVRTASYEHFKEQIAKRDGIKLANAKPEQFDKICREAAEMVSDRYFDFGNMSAFSKEVGRRILPFWNFAINNVRYYGDKVTTSTGMARMNNLNRIVRGIGSSDMAKDPLTVAAYNEANPFYENGQPRNLPAKRGGANYTFTYPKAARSDAAASILSLGTPTDNPFVRGIYPMVKGWGEMAANKDLFFDQPMFPSTMPNGAVSMGKGGYLGLLQNTILGNNATKADGGLLKTGANLLLGTHGIQPSPIAGSPQQTSDANTVLTKLREMFPVMPALPTAPGRAASALYNLSNIPIVDDVAKGAYSVLQHTLSGSPSNSTRKAIDPLVDFVNPFGQYVVRDPRLNLFPIKNKIEELKNAPKEEALREQQRSRPKTFFDK